MADISYYANLNLSTDSHAGTEDDPFSAADLQAEMIVASSDNETYNIEGSYTYTTEFAFKNKTGDVIFQSWGTHLPARIQMATSHFLNSYGMTSFTMKNIIIQKTGISNYYNWDLTDITCSQYYENVIFIGAFSYTNITGFMQNGISDFKLCHFINPSSTSVPSFLKAPASSVSLVVNSCYFDGNAIRIFATSNTGSYKYSSFYNHGSSWVEITATLPDGGNNHDNNTLPSLLNGPVYSAITDDKFVYQPNSFVNSYTADPTLTGGIDIFGITRRSIPGVGATEYPTGTLTNNYYVDLSLGTNSHAGTQADPFSAEDFRGALIALSVDNETYSISETYNYTTTFQISNKSGNISLKSLNNNDPAKIRIPSGTGANAIIGSGCTCQSITFQNIMIQINNTSLYYSYDFTALYPGYVFIYNSIFIGASSYTSQQGFMIAVNIVFTLSQFINPSASALTRIIDVPTTSVTNIIDSCYFDGPCIKVFDNAANGYYTYSSFYNHGGSFSAISNGLPDGGENQDYHASASLLNGTISNIITDNITAYQPKTLIDSQTANPALIGGIDIFGTARRNPPGVGAVEYPITYITPVLLSFDSSKIKMLYQDKLTYYNDNANFISDNHNKTYTVLVSKVADPVEFSRESKLFIELHPSDPYDVISDKNNTLLLEIEAYYDDEMETIIFNKISNFYGDLFNKIFEDGKYVFIFDELVNLLKIYVLDVYDKGLSGNRNIVNNIRFGGSSVL